MKKLVVVSLLLALQATPSLAGKFFEGWGENPNEAMAAAIENAIKGSPAGCIGKDWSAIPMEDNCREGMGGVICRAEGSNHRGSCMQDSDLDGILKVIEAFN